MPLPIRLLIGVDILTITKAQDPCDYVLVKYTGSFGLKQNLKDLNILTIVIHRTKTYLKN